MDAQPAPGWLWVVLGAVAVLLAVATLFVLRLRASLRALHLQNAQLQQSQGELRDLKASLERDLGERQAADVEKEAALAAAERLVQEHTAFLAQMNHELRTPLNGILYFANVLQRDHPLTERQQRGLRTIEESGQHLLALVNDIVDLARLDAGRLELAPLDVGLALFLQRLCDTVRTQAEAKGLPFSLKLAPGLPVAVRVDETRMRQVLLNLLANAVKFTDHGTVSLDVKALNPVGPAHGGESSVRLRFEVCDSGSGMSEAQLARLFQPFEPVDAVKERATGAGLGLAISRRLVRLMGGDIHVSSRPGEGSVFWFEVDAPLVNAAARPPVAARGSSQSLDEAQPLLGNPPDSDGLRHVAPPSGEMIVLRELARIGNMRTIRERADYLKRLDPRYRPFAEQLASLAEQCQSKAIANLVESYSVDKGAT